MRSWRRSNAPVCQSGVGSANLPERTIFMELWCQQQHSGLLIRTVRVQLPPAPPTLTLWSLRAPSEKSSDAEQPEPQVLSRRARAAKGPACKAEARGCKSRRRVHFWGCSAKSSTPRLQRGGDGALPSSSTSFAREVFRRCTAVFQTAGAGALPASGTIGPRCPSGRVGLQIRPGGCESLRACQIPTEVKPI